MVEGIKHAKTRSRQEDAFDFLQKTIDFDQDMKKNGSTNLSNKVNHPKRVKTNPPQLPRSFQYNTKIVQALLQPGRNLGIPKEVQYTSHTKNEFRSYETMMKKHMKDLSVKADVTATRRMLETFNEDSINQGRKMQTLDNEINNKVEKYLKSKITQEMESELTPWRFSPTGWKYQKKGSQNKYLNHENKINILGTTHIKSFSINTRTPNHQQSTFNSQDYKKTQQDFQDDPNYGFKSHYSQTFYNKSGVGQFVNSPLQSIQIKNNEKLKEYNYPPIPTIQLAKFAQIKNNYEQYSKTNRQEINKTEITPSPTKTRSFSMNKTSPIKQITLNGMQSTLRDQIGEEDYKIWGGVRVKLDSPFGKTRDAVKDWQAAFYNGQYFKMIPK